MKPSLTAKHIIWYQMHLQDASNINERYYRLDLNCWTGYQGNPTPTKRKPTTFKYNILPKRFWMTAHKVANMDITDRYLRLKYHCWPNIWVNSLTNYMATYQPMGAK